jgi:hypothetical protein
VQRSAHDNSIEYRAPHWLIWTAIAASILFGLVALGAVLDRDIPSYVLWVGAVGVLLGIGGVIEAMVGRVVLEEDRIVIRQWFRTERLPLADVAAVSLEGGRVSLRLKTGTWKRLPEWLGADRSLGRRLRDRLKADASS